MDRMREHVMKEFDKNNDRMLSFQEFELGVNGTGAKNEQGWQVIYYILIYSIIINFVFFSPLKIVLFILIKIFKSFLKN